MCLQRAGLIGLLVQTFIAIELRNFNNGSSDDLRPYIPFLDDCWTGQAAGMLSVFDFANLNSNKDLHCFTSKLY